MRAVLIASGVLILVSLAVIASPLLTWSNGHNALYQSELTDSYAFGYSGLFLAGVLVLSAAVAIAVATYSVLRPRPVLNWISFAIGLAWLATGLWLRGAPSACFAGVDECNGLAPGLVAACGLLTMVCSAFLAARRSGT